MKKLKFMIAITVIIIIITTILLMLLNKRKDDNISNKEINNNTMVIDDENELVTNTTTIILENPQSGIIRIKDNKTFYSVENCIKKYESIINLNYTEQLDELGQPSIAAEYGIYNESEKQEAILKLLDKDYINKNNITTNNVLNFVDATTIECKVECLKINKLVNNNTKVIAYSVYAKKTINGIEKNIYYIVKTGIGNVFTIYPVESNLYKSIDDIKITNTTEYIENNKLNTFIESSINESQIATKYFQEYKSLLLNNADEAYNRLDEQYKEKRFGTLEGFKEYIANNKENIELMQIYRYNVEKYSDYNEYIIKDRYENIYFFNEKAPKDYTVLLDDYTIETEEFKESYNSTTDEGKVKTNAYKFIKMINNKDYKNVYALLNNTFKENNYNTIDKFISSIKNKMFDINKIDSIEINEEDNYYVCNIDLSDYKGEIDNIVSMQIIINLSSDTNFEMSFSFV